MRWEQEKFYAGYSLTLQGLMHRHYVSLIVCDETPNQATVFRNGNGPEQEVIKFSNIGELLRSLQNEVACQMAKDTAELLNGTVPIYKDE